MNILGCIELAFGLNSYLTLLSLQNEEQPHLASFAIGSPKSYQCPAPLISIYHIVTNLNNGVKQHDISAGEQYWSIQEKKIEIALLVG